MKVALTGWNGFLAGKLRENTEIVWQEELTDSDMILLMGSPTFTNIELDEHDAQVIHQYVRETIKQIDRYTNPIIFASTTGVNDIRLDHKGSTCYNLAKLYIENYIINNCDQWMILRIGTIVSTDNSDIDKMRPDRIQQRLRRKEISGIDFEDNYLLIDEFVNTTVNCILNFKNGIIEYPLIKLSLPKLMALGK